MTSPFAKKDLSIILICGFMALVLFLAASDAQAQSELPRYEPGACPSEVLESQNIECGYLVVPESYDDFDGATVKLPVAIIRSRSKAPASDPLLFLRGGPGISAFPTISILADSPLVNDRDLIVLEQRGTGYAEPSLDCEVSELANDALPCLERLKEEDLDLALFTTETMVADLQALRQALDVDEWNLFGESYSTLVILLTMQAHPEGTRSVILDSVNPPSANVYEEGATNYDRALNAYFGQCKADPECAAAFPSLRDSFYELLERLNSEPVAVTVINQSNGQLNLVTIDGNWLLAQTFDALYGHLSTNDPLTYWPLLIDQLERGNLELLAPWVNNPVIDWEELLTFGAYFSVMCQDQFAAADPQIMEKQADAHPELDDWAMSAFTRQVCESWELPPASISFDETLVSDIPTLILAGEHDPITPPEWSKGTAEFLAASHYYEFPGMGHYVSGANPCAREIIVSFLDDPASVPKDSCLAIMPDRQFVLPKDIHMKPGLFRYIEDSDLENPKQPFMVLLWFTLLVFVIEIIYLFVSLIIRLIRGPQSRGAGYRSGIVAHLLAGFVALINIGFIFALTNVLDQLANTNPLVLRFGVPVEYGPLFEFPVVTELLTAIMLVIVFLAWIAGYWSIRQRIFYSLVTLAAVTFSSLMAYWELLLLP